MGLEKDLPSGEALVACFRPFIQHLAKTGLSPKTVRRQVDNLWSLGGEIIRDLHYDPSYENGRPKRLLREAVHQDGGPLVHNGSEDQQRSFDATCRKLHRPTGSVGRRRHTRGSASADPTAPSETSGTTK